jgi:hypothetical protein
MTDTSTPAAPASPAGDDPAEGAADGELVPDDLVIEDLSDVPWPIPAPGICICTVGTD